MFPKDDLSTESITKDLDSDSWNVLLSALRNIGILEAQLVSRLLETIVLYLQVSVSCDMSIPPASLFGV
jgi:hypothetical protein